MNNTLSCKEIKIKLSQLGTFWEQHRIIGVDGTFYYGNGRNKEILYKELFSKFYSKDDFENKTILDIGCNSGGNLVQLSKFNPRKMVGIDANSLCLKQCQFIMELNHISNTKLFLYQFKNSDTIEDYSKKFGSFDVIFCLGIIYLLQKKTVQTLLKYLYRCGKKVIMSSFDYNSNHRPYIDWDVSISTIKTMIKDAGFSEIKILEYSKNEIKRGRTNTFYFELIF